MLTPAAGSASRWCRARRARSSSCPSPRASAECRGRARSWAWSWCHAPRSSMRIDERAVAMLDPQVDRARLLPVGVLDRVVAGLADGEDGVVALVLGEPAQLEPACADVCADRRVPPGRSGPRRPCAAGTSSRRTIRSAMSSERADVRRDLREDPGRRADPRQRGRGADHGGQQVDAGVDAPAAALDEPVGVRDERPPAGSSTVASRISDGLDVAERRRERVPEALDDGARRRSRAATADVPRRRR